MRRDLARRWLAVLVACVGGCAIGMAAEPEYPLKQDPAGKVDWLPYLSQQLAPLQHERGQRWPLVLWESVGFNALTPTDYQRLLARGVVQHLRLEESGIPAAQAMQAAGMPVIMMQGEGGTWPSKLAGPERLWQHLFDYGFHPRQAVHACPTVATGYALAGEQVRTRLRAFKAAGVTVNAVWMDWEGDPMPGPEAYHQALNCQRCRAALPPTVLASRRAYSAYSWRRYLELVGTYLGAPVAEVYPGCSTTNWNAVITTPEHPVLNWVNTPLPVATPPNLTATNPIAYGVTTYWHRAWPKDKVPDRASVDTFYTHLLLREVSADSVNRRACAPDLGALPWVARWLPDEGDLALPVLSRAGYREVLRHLWLRGIDGMQVFNAQIYAGYEPMAIAEVEDAAAVYDEMLEFKDLLTGGEPLNLDIPGPQATGAWWSGVRKGDAAVIRTSFAGEGAASVRVQPWPHIPLDLPATSAGTTYRLTRRSPEVVEIVALPAAAAPAPIVMPARVPPTP